MSLRRVGKMGLTTSQTRSSSLLVAAGVPGVPTVVSATATGNTTATVTWTAPSFVGESAITTYTVTGGGSVSVSGTTGTVTGLTANTSYTFSVAAVNAVGTGAAVAASSITTTNINEATGGTVQTYTSGGINYKSHSFLSNGNFIVTAAPQTFDCLVIGGGGGGGYWDYNHGDGGSGGFGVQSAITLAVASYAAVVGAGGGYGSAAGGTSTFSSVTANGGARGLNSPENGGNYSNGSANGITSNYRTGTNVTYGGGGGTNNAGYSAAANTGGGGGGGHTNRPGGGGANGGSGGSGIVVIRYVV